MGAAVHRKTLSLRHLRLPLGSSDSLHDGSASMSSTPEPTEPATVLLQRLHAGDAEAGQRLLPLIYAELRQAADLCLQRERPGHTLQATALVHEAWIRMCGAGASPQAESRGHFVRIAARAMRQILVDHARARSARKRGTRIEVESIDALMVAFEDRSIDVLALDETLERLTHMDEGLARIVELRYFAGLNLPEVALALEVSLSTVERGWRAARAWLRQEMSDADEPPT